MYHFKLYNIIKYIGIFFLLIFSFIFPCRKKGKYITEDEDSYSEEEEEEELPSSPEANITYFYEHLHSLFPKYFPIPGEYGGKIKSARMVFDRNERGTGKIFVPVGGSCSMFPKGVFVQTKTGYNITKIIFPKSGQTFELE